MTDSIVHGARRALLGLCLALTLATGAVAQTTETTDADDPEGWRFKLAPLYIWFAGLEGDAAVGPAAGPVKLSFGDVLSNLTGIFTFHFEAGKRKWNLFADGMHLKMKPGTTLPSGATLSVTVKNNIAEIGGTYRVHDGAPWVDVLGGVRYTTLDVTSSSLPGININEEWFDGFGGVRLGHEFGAKKQWSVSGRADVGAGGADLTWSAYALVGWRFAESVALNAGYKWLAYDYETGSGPSRFTWDVTYQGPIAGLVFNW